MFANDVLFWFTCEFRWMTLRTSIWSVLDPVLKLSAIFINAELTTIGAAKREQICPHSWTASIWSIGRWEFVSSITRRNAPWASASWTCKDNFFCWKKYPSENIVAVSKNGHKRRRRILAIFGAMAPKNEPVLCFRLVDYLIDWSENPSLDCFKGCGHWSLVSILNKYLRWTLSELKAKTEECFIIGNWESHCLLSFLGSLSRLSEGLNKREPFS